MAAKVKAFWSKKGFECEASTALRRYTNILRRDLTTTVHGKEATPPTNGSEGGKGGARGSAGVIEVYGSDASPQFHMSSVNGEMLLDEFFSFAAALAKTRKSGSDSRFWNLKSMVKTS